jgi:flagellar basal-body rod protein FlgC
MTTEKIMEGVRFGLEFERMRLEASSQNIARANVATRPGEAAHISQVTAPAATFASALGIDAGAPGHPLVTEIASGTRQIHDPADPMADANGTVTYPEVDLAGEMSTLISASRSYEADVRAFNTLHSMELHSLNIGDKS